MKKVLLLIVIVFGFNNMLYSQHIPFIKYFKQYKVKKAGYNLSQDLLELKQDSTFSISTSFIRKKGKFFEFLNKELIEGTWKKENDTLLLFLSKDHENMKFLIKKKKLLFISIDRSEKKRFTWKYIYGGDSFRGDIEE